MTQQTIFQQTEACLTTAQAATFLKIKPQTLRKWRVQGHGPKYVRLGNGLGARVLYRRVDLETWLAERTFSSTSEETERRDSRG